jgi:hypothetical protein
MSTTNYFTQPDQLAPQTKARSVDINALSNAVRVAFEKIPVSDQDWRGMHDFSGGTLRVKLPVLTADAANKGYVDTRILAAGQMPPLPAAGTSVLSSVDGAFVPQLLPAAGTSLLSSVDGVFVPKLLPGAGTYSLYAVDGALVMRASGPMNDAAALAQTLSLNLSM